MIGLSKRSPVPSTAKPAQPAKFLVTVFVGIKESATEDRVATSQ
jgi:hypothetical protein